MYTVYRNSFEKKDLCGCLILLTFCADPSPWLLVSDALKEKNKAKAYDPKKSVWVPNKVKYMIYKKILIPL
jgi:hypothetical protein